MPAESATRKAGYVNLTKIADTLQGGIWKAIQIATNREVVLKVADIDLHSQNKGVVNGIKYKVGENILMEKAILKYITTDSSCPDSIVKYIDSFRSEKHYYLVMEYGGDNLLDFVIKAHKLIEIGQLEMSEWHRLCKIIFKQMCDSVNHIHSKNVSHYDISLENFLINELNISVNEDKNGKKTIQFMVNHNQGVDIKLCDFGVAEVSKDTHFQSNRFVGKHCYQSPEITAKKQFNAQSNDLFSLGVCLFMLIVGNAPWKKTSVTDATFNKIMNGNLLYLLNKWNKLHYIDQHLHQLYKQFFQFENKRITMEQILKCKWLQQSCRPSISVA